MSPYTVANNKDEVVLYFNTEYVNWMVKYRNIGSVYDRILTVSQILNGMFAEHYSLHGKSIQDAETLLRYSVDAQYKILTRECLI